MSDLGLEEDFVKEIRQDFLEDLKDRLAVMNRDVVEMEKKGLSSPLLRDLFRHSHNIKGTSGTLGLMEISSIAHRLEDFFSLMSSQDSTLSKDHFPELFTLLDFMEQQRELYLKGTAPEEIHRLTAMKLSPKNKKKLNILILETSKSFKNILKNALQKEKLEPSLAQTSLEALTRAVSEPIDLLITSQEHAVLDGLSLICMLKANPDKARLFTVLLTSEKILSPIPDKIIPKDKNFLQNILSIIRELEKQ